MVNDAPLDESQYRGLCDHLISVDVSGIPWWARLLDKCFRFPQLDFYKRMATSVWLRSRFFARGVDYDCVIINYAQWEHVVPRQLRANSILLSHDIMFFRLQSFLRGTLLDRWKILLNKSCELSIFKRFSRVIVLGGYEKDLLLQSGIPDERVVVMGMPILNSINPVSDAIEPRYDFIFVGGDSAQNIAALECFVGAFRGHPQVANRLCLAIAGSIGTGATIRGIDFGGMNVQILGLVDDLSMAYARSKMVVGTIPMGSGIKVKVVEGMAHGKPVLATRKALEGIPHEHGVNVLVLEEVEGSEFGAFISKMLSDDQVLAQYGKSAQSSINEAFSEDSCYGELLKVIEEM